MSRINVLLLAGAILLCGCSTGTPAPTATPEPTATRTPVCGQPGTIERLKIDSPVQGYPYPIEVYLPPCYAERTQEAYPVLYLIPWRSGGATDWFHNGVADTADSLIRAGEIPPLVIVSVGDIDPDPQAEAIRQDVIPYVERTYRIKTGGRYHAVAGGSLGGVGAYRVALQEPGAFGAVGMFGIGPISGEEDQIRDWLSRMEPAERPRFFFNCGLQDGYMLERAKVIISILDEFDVPHKEIFVDGQHIYGFWAQHFAAFYRWLAEDWE
jgi:enterochelin esterase-like enzyme